MFKNRSLVMKKQLLFWLLLMAISTVGAQESLITIKGTVTDSKSKATLPGVTIHVQGEQIFTQSNGDGKYIIKVPERLRDANLIFNVFGYERDTMTVKAAAKRPNVKLKTGGAIKLNTVTVSEYKPQTLIREAVARIPQNNWTDTTIGTFFYRDCRQLNDGLYLFDEMVFDALRVGYDKHNTIKETNNNYKHPDVRPIESNYKAILFSRLLVNDTAYINEITGGTGSNYLNYSDNDVLFDPAEIPNTTLFLSNNKRKQKIWDYKMESFTDADGVAYYLVTMTNETKLLGKSFHTAKVTIAKSNLAIKKVEYISDAKLSKIPWPFNKLAAAAGIDSLYYTDNCVYNYGDVDGKLTLTSFTKHKSTTYFFVPGSDLGAREQYFVLDCQGVLTAQRPGDASFLNDNAIQSPVRIAVSERQSGELRYDEEFWNQYNFVPLEEDLLKKLNARLKQ